MRLYTDFDLFQQPFEGQEATVVMLLPFEPNRPENGNAHPFDSCYDEWIQTAAKAFELTSIEQADAGVFPVQWITREHPRHSEFKRALDDFTLRCERAGIPVLLFFQHDFDEEIDVRNTLVFRTSLYRSRRKAYEHAVPYWSEDILRIYANGRLVEREKGEKPVVGFC